MSSQEIVQQPSRIENRWRAGRVHAWQNQSTLLPIDRPIGPGFTNKRPGRFANINIVNAPLSPGLMTDHPGTNGRWGCVSLKYTAGVGRSSVPSFHKQTLLLQSRACLCVCMRPCSTQACRVQTDPSRPGIPSMPGRSGMPGFADKAAFHKEG